MTRQQPASGGERVPLPPPPLPPPGAHAGKASVRSAAVLNAQPCWHCRDYAAPTGAVGRPDILLKAVTIAQLSPGGALPPAPSPAPAAAAAAA